MHFVISNLIKTIVISGLLYLTGARVKIWFYIVLFFGLLTIDVLFSKLEATEFCLDQFTEFQTHNFKPDSQSEIKMLSKLFPNIECLTVDEREFYQKKLNQHQYDAERTWNNAKNKCWYLPNISNRNSAKNAFAAVMASFGGSTPMSKLVCSLIGLLTSYGLDCIDEWYYIEEQLQWCQYHCEMVEFYNGVMAKG